MTAYVGVVRLKHVVVVNNIVTSKIFNDFSGGRDTAEAVKPNDDIFIFPIPAPVSPLVGIQIHYASFIQRGWSILRKGISHVDTRKMGYLPFSGIRNKVEIGERTSR